MKAATLRGYAHLIAPAVADVRVPATEGLGLLCAVVHLAHPGAVVIEIGVGTLRGQGLDQLILGGGHPFDGLECLQMLRTHRGNDADGGMHQPTHLPDIADMPRPHFSHEDLMGRQELFPDGAGDAHGGIEAGGGNQRRVLLA